MKKYVEIIIEFSEESVEYKSISSLAMKDFFCDGIHNFSMEEEEVDELLGKDAYSGGETPAPILERVDVNQNTKESRKIFFFHSGDYQDNSKKFISMLHESYPNLIVNSRTKNWENWNTSWQKHFKPIKISERLKIYPDWYKKDVSGREIVYIHPGMGFGTGGHETTFLCLTLFDEISDKYSKVDSVLDFGCGSGILGIASQKIVGCNVVYCDTDRDALDNCVYNLSLNFDNENFSNTVVVSRERFKLNKKHTLVFANILENILILEGDVINESVVDGGDLIVSGLLNEQVEDMIAFFQEKGFTYIKSVRKNDWSAILFRKEK